MLMYAFLKNMSYLYSINLDLSICLLVTCFIFNNIILRLIYYMQYIAYRFSLSLQIDNDTLNSTLQYPIMSFYNHLLISTLSRSRFWYLNQPKLILHNVKGMPVCGAYSKLTKDNRTYIFKHIPGQMGLNLKVKTTEVINYMNFITAN